MSTRDFMLVTPTGNPRDPDVAAVILTAQYPAAGAPVLTVIVPETL